MKHLLTLIFSLNSIFLLANNNSPTSISISTTQTDLTCNSVCTGVINISATGGTTPYQYSIDNGTTFSTNSSFNNLCAGPYSIVVIDNIGAQAISTVTLNEPYPLSLTLGSTNVLCAGSCDGSINSIPSGGIGLYTYTWGPTGTGGNTPIVNNLCAGTYTLTVTDANNCTTDTTTTIVGPPPISITTSTVQAMCGNCDGQISATASNGNAPYTYTWGPTGTGGNVNNVTNLCAGNYSLTVSDANNCSSSTNIVVTTLGTPVNVQAFSDTIICIGGTATLTAQASGGNGSFFYQWDNGDNNQTTAVSPTSQQTYCVTATDGYGCTSLPSCVLVSLYPSISTMAFGNQTICEGDTASISVVATGGFGGPYSYTWDQGLGSGSYQVVSPTQTTTYNVTVTDQCETPASINSLIITIGSIHADFTFTGEPTVTFNPINSIPGSSYTWSFGDGGSAIGPSATYTYSSNGNYTACLDVISSDGCSDSICHTITINNVSVVENTLDQINISPNPITNGQFTITAPEYKILSIEILNILGQPVWKGTTSNGKTINISNLDKGNYLFKISSEGFFTTKKMVID